jgi:hypothetical protein
LAGRTGTISDKATHMKRNLVPVLAVVAQGARKAATAVKPTVTK